MPEPMVKAKKKLVRKDYNVKYSEPDALISIQIKNLREATYKLIIY
jgi:hypothetical protein